MRVEFVAGARETRRKPAQPADCTTEAADCTTEVAEPWRRDAHVVKEFVKCQSFFGSSNEDRRAPALGKTWKMGWFCFLGALREEVRLAGARIAYEREHSRRSSSAGLLDRTNASNWILYPALYPPIVVVVGELQRLRAGLNILFKMKPGTGKAPAVMM